MYNVVDVLRYDHKSTLLHQTLLRASYKQQSSHHDVINSCMYTTFWSRKLKENRQLGRPRSRYKNGS